MAPSDKASHSIPLFDLPLSSGSADLAHSVTAAAHVYGFLYIRTPLFSSQNVSHMFSLSSSFFSLPTGTKSLHTRQSNNRGFAEFHSEGLDPKSQPEGDPKEAFNFGEFSTAGTAQQPLPDTFAAAEADIAEFQGCCRRVCLQLLELIAEGLGIDSETNEGNQWFATRHDPTRGPSGTILRLLHYPPLSSPSHSGTIIRAGAHSDYGSLTLLFRQPGDAGLEISPPQSHEQAGEPLGAGKEWLHVAVFPPGAEFDPSPPVLVNIGDLLSYWTGGWLRSTVHRVMSPEEEGARERFSIAYFCHPIDDTQLVPVPSAFVRQHISSPRQNGVTNPDPAPGNEKVLTATDHLQERLRATYGLKHGEGNTA